MTMTGMIQKNIEKKKKKRKHEETNAEKKKMRAMKHMK
jgi:hypothetical protein